MVGQAKSNIWVNKALSAIRANLGRIAVLILFLGFTAALTTTNFREIFQNVLGENSFLLPYITAVSFTCSIGLESLVLVLHLNDRHKESLGILIALGLSNFAKLYVAVFSDVDSWGISEGGQFIIVLLFCVALALGTYWLCIDISNDKQFKYICKKMIFTEKTALITEEKEDNKFFEKELLRINEKKGRESTKYGEENYTKVVKELADLQRNLQ